MTGYLTVLLRNLGFLNGYHNLLLPDNLVPAFYLGILAVQKLLHLGKLGKNLVKPGVHLLAMLLIILCKLLVPRRTALLATAKSELLHSLRIFRLSALESGFSHYVVGAQPQCRCVSLLLIASLLFRCLRTFGGSFLLVFGEPLFGGRLFLALAPDYRDKRHMKVRGLLVHVKNRTHDVLLAVFPLRPFHGFTAPVHQPSLSDNFRHSLRRSTQPYLDAAHLVFPDLALVFVAVLVRLMLDGHETLLDGGGAPDLTGFRNELPVMLCEVGTLDVVGYVLRAVSLLPLDVGRVGDWRPIALVVMADNVIAHFFWLWIDRRMYLSTRLYVGISIFHIDCMNAVTSV